MAVPTAGLLLLLLLLVATPPTNSFLDFEPLWPLPQQKQEEVSAPLPPTPAVEQKPPTPAVEQQPTPAVEAPLPSPLPRGPRRVVAKQILDAHNQVRATLNEKPLVWDAHLARVARRYSIMLSLTGCTVHHSNGIYGENLFWGYGRRWKAMDAVRVWILEADKYNVAENSCYPGTMCGHYTQVVWNATERLGCARVLCPAGIGVIVTCNYDPPGNYVGERPFEVHN